jgi:N-acetylglutamate synthase-like GNAT family acetyltransferase
MLYKTFSFHWIKPNTFDEFTFIKQMIDKNNYEYTNVHLLMTKEHRVVCVAVISKTMDRVKIEALEVLEEYRHKGIGSEMLNHIKDSFQMIELHSVKEAEDFYIKNGFVKTKELNTFLWIRV